MFVFTYQLAPADNQYQESATLSVTTGEVETGWTDGEGTGLDRKTFQTSDMTVFLDFLFERQEDWMIQVVIRRYL